MAKSKEQKRDEAMMRARAALPVHRLRWMDHQPGGHVYEETKKHNPQYAETIREQAQITFEKAAARAGTDLHGNPLK